MAGSLPQAMRLRLVGCRVVLPLYEDVPAELRAEMRFVTSFSVPVSWRRQYCGVFEARYKGVIYYLLDNQYYFKRAGLYGHYDDAERFAFLARAALEMLPHIEFKPDVIEANDWQSALVPVYYSLFYANQPGYENIKTVMTIHNIQYQGKYGMEILEDVFGIPHTEAQIVEYGDCLNLLKGGIETANLVTTVSPTYAQELLDPWFAHGLDGILRQRSWKLKGILNGIDTENYDPQTDKYIAANFSLDTLENRKEDKADLQKEFGLPIREDVPVIAMCTRLVAHKGLDLVKQVLGELLQDDVQFIVLGTGDAVYENFFREMQYAHPQKIGLRLGFIPALSRKIYAGADIFLMPSKSEPCGLAQMIALRYGAIPVVRETGGLKDSIQDSGDGEGNGFTFQNYDAYDMLGALRRALEGYGNREGWDILVRRAMECDNSWGRSANEYIRTFKALIKNGK